MNGPQSIRYCELPMNSVSAATIHRVALAKSDGYGMGPCKQDVPSLRTTGNRFFNSHPDMTWKLVAKFKDVATAA